MFSGAQADRVRVLGIESATRTASVGVVDGEEVLADRFLEGAGNHAVSLLPLIHETLVEAGVTLADLEGVAVSIGPGSFTGVRIGLGIGKGLAFGAGLKLVGISTLEAFACSVPDGSGTICPVLDARRGEVYAAAYRFCDGLRECVREAVVLPVGKFVADVLPGCRLVGDAAQQYGDFLREHLGPDVELLTGVRPSGAVVAHLGAERLALGAPDDAVRLEPNYVRAPDAERNRHAKG